MDVAQFLIGDLPPGLAALTGLAVVLLFAIHHRLREIARQGYEFRDRVMDRFEQSDKEHSTTHGKIEKEVAMLGAKINGVKR